MKRVITLLGLLAGVSSVANAETHWVYGVSEHGGWYDADKTNYDEDYNKCWAAVSSNLINWWQIQYDVSKVGAPTGDEVWNKYRTSANRVMSNVQVGVDWWWTGKADDDYTILGIADSFNSSAKYYKDVIPSIDSYSYNDYVYHVEGTATQLATYLYDSLIDGVPRLGIGLNVGSSATSANHGVTVWGADFAADKTLTALWLTDSDDAIGSSGDLDLFRVSVEYKDDALYLPDYWNSGARYVESLTVLDASATDAWGMPRIELTPPVPEPTTATLSLLALAGLAARRRRR